MSAKIVVAFTCSGKTWLYENQDKFNLKVIDLMERDFAFLDFEKGIRNHEYPDNLMYEIQRIKNDYDIITLTFSKTKCDMLDRYFINFILVGPSEDEYEKWKERLRKRGTRRGFSLWDSVIKDKRYKYSKIVLLNSNEYLSDKINEIIRQE